VKSAVAKMIKKFHKTGSLLDKNRNWQKLVLTPRILQDIKKKQVHFWTRIEIGRSQC